MLQHLHDLLRGRVLQQVADWLVDFEAVSVHYDLEQKLSLSVVVLPNVLVLALDDAVAFLPNHVLCLVDYESLIVEEFRLIVEEPVGLFAPGDCFDH